MIKQILQRKIVSGVAVNLIGLLLISGLNIISIKIAFQYFGKDVFGVYTILSTFIGYVLLANFGIPTAATILISERLDKSSQKGIVIQSFMLICFVSCILFCLAMLCNFDYLGILLGVNQSLVQDFSFCISVAIFSVALKLPFQLYQSIFLGNQMIASNKFVDVILIFTLVILLYIGNHYQLSFNRFYIVHSVVTTCIVFFAFAHAMQMYRHDKPIYSDDGIKNLKKSSFGFFMLSLPVTLGWTVDNLIISSVLGISEVSSFAFSSKIYMLGLAIVSVVPNTLFSFYLRDKVTNGLDSLSVIYQSALVIMKVIGGFLALVILSFDELMINLWSGSISTYAGPAFSFAMCVYVYATAIVNLNSSFLTGVLNVRTVTFLSYIEVLLHITLSIFLAGSFGILGIGLAIAISTFIIPYLILPYLVRNFFQKNTISRELPHLIFCFLPAAILVCMVKLFVVNDQTSYILIVASFLYFIVATWLLEKEKIVFSYFMLIKSYRK